MVNFASQGNISTCQQTAALHLEGMKKTSLSLMSLFLYELFESLAEECAALPPRRSQSGGTSRSSRLHKSSLAV